jgi:hypothetical protein
MSQRPKEDIIQVGRIFLDLINPRFEAVRTEEEAIRVLCKAEDVYPLAADIVSQGSLNPLEKVALIPTGSKPKDKKRQAYTVVEGNRRLCALKLLMDPELAPSESRKKFQKLAEDWTSAKSIPSIIFAERGDARVWLQRMHEGPQGGVGRKSWNSEQKQRFSGSRKNQAAQEFLDYCEESKFITKGDRQGKLTTVQRFITKDVFKDHMGIETTPDGQLKRTRDKVEFDKMAKAFVSDLIGNKKVTSRMNKGPINQYARDLTKEQGVSDERIEAESLQISSASKKKTRKPRPKPVRHPKYLQNSPEIDKKLKLLKNHKLSSLYASLVNVLLADHTPLLSVGMWSFFETLTACAGRNDGIDFTAFLSKGKMSQYLLIGKGDQKVMTSALKRVQEFGNQTKHHSSGAAFSAPQLNNDLICLDRLILKVIDEAISKN